ncbi:cytochrome P450 [Streptomyces caniscabiei]|uniref:Cytochrome P450 n=1 Tax=Streptomyces caniscabiei TaxID=2746961 RepID=A0A927QLA2_9ACTN|nr:cytochrome P450 [Streptomyces caniscabiei]MBD9730140.1 cytochrome P450 [Streptomyces caniscabiei]MDX3516156.1 cytochrome P450 [Streptomyces caniscabiei]MDX3725216.1 cytochrome P450 [Streptomyces caniscabiei]MDX3733734.1 cytochrome P450 [Streptomyces caniscabiei]WEO21693.1 cytochrome P450 [Streptomyces caniscabiei]
MGAQQVQRVAGGVPWLGHVPRLVRDPLALLTSQREEPAVVRMQLAGRAVYLVNSAQAARQVLVSSVFDKGGPFMNTARVLVGNGVITCSNADHRRQQPVMRPAFHRDRVARYAPVMGDCITQALSTWCEGERIDVEAQMYALAAQVVARTLISAPAGRAAADTMAAALPVLVEGMFRQMLAPWPLLHRLPLPANRRFQQAQARLELAVGHVIEQYRAGGAPGDDLLSLVMAAHDDDGRPLDDTEVRDQILSVLAAGVETTASLLAWTLHALADHPDVESRLWAELDRELSGHDPVFADIPRLPYTRQVLIEVLRLWPPTWMLSRVALEQTILAGFTVPRGADVVVSPYALHRDPAVFPDPKRLDPDRWLPERVTSAQRQAFIAFGGGRRKCLGEHYGMTEAILALATISSRWQLRKASTAPLRPLPRFLLTPKAGPLTLTRRTASAGGHRTGAGQER